MFLKNISKQYNKTLEIQDSAILHNDMKIPMLFNFLNELFLVLCVWNVLDDKEACCNTYFTKKVKER